MQTLYHSLRSQITYMVFPPKIHILDLINEDRIQNLRKGTICVTTDLCSSKMPMSWKTKKKLKELVLDKRRLKIIDKDILGAICNMWVWTLYKLVILYYCNIILTGFPGGSAVKNPPAVPVCTLSHFSCVRLFATAWTVTHQAPLSMDNNTGVVCHAPLLQGIFLTQGLNWCLLHRR